MSSRATIIKTMHTLLKEILQHNAMSIALTLYHKHYIPESDYTDCIPTKELRKSEATRFSSLAGFLVKLKHVLDEGVLDGQHLWELGGQFAAPFDRGRL